MRVNAESPSRISRRGDAIRVSTKGADAALDPLEPIASVKEFVVTSALAVGKDAITRERDAVRNMNGDDGRSKLDRVLDEAGVI